MSKNESGKVLSDKKLVSENSHSVLSNLRFPWPITTDSIRNSVLAAIDEGSWGNYHAHWTEDLISELSIAFSIDHVMLCSSGTFAVELGLRSLGVTPESEVILAGYDFPGNFRSIESIGAFPVLVDVIENGWVIDTDQVALALTENTSAVIVSHLHGQLADIEAIREIVSDWNQNHDGNVKILEDACQVPGATIGSKKLGTLGDVGVLSFGGSKLLSAGRGGAILTNEVSYFQRAVIFSERGNDAFPMSQLQAAALTPQISTMAGYQKKRNDRAVELVNLLKNFEEIVPLKQTVGNCDTTYYKLPWLYRPKTNSPNRDELITALVELGLPVGEGFRGFTRRSSRRCRKVNDLSHAMEASKNTVLLSHPILLHDEIKLASIENVIKKALGI
ncbi:MAG: DegT/DnrJ/EryC1/StrS family aminotransferase [Planctomycetota bacterium]